MQHCGFTSDLDHLWVTVRSFHSMVLVFSGTVSNIQSAENTTQMLYVYQFCIKTPVLANNIIALYYWSIPSLHRVLFLPHLFVLSCNSVLTRSVALVSSLDGVILHTLMHILWVLWLSGLGLLMDLGSSLWECRFKSHNCLYAQGMCQKFPKLGSLDYVLLSM